MWYSKSRMKWCFFRLLVICMTATVGLLHAQQAEVAVQPVPEQPAESSAGVSVLCYSRFSAAEGQGGIGATTFAAQMNYLKEKGITPLSLQQFLDWRRGAYTLPGNSVLITLDEADYATYAVAFPVLKQLGFPFVVFADGRNFSDSSMRLKVEQLQEMQRAGGAVGSRSMSLPRACDWKHAALSGPDAAQKMAERELGLSAQRVTTSFGSCEAFAYPRGYADAEMVENLAIYGYKIAFGLQEGRVQRETSSYALLRYRITDMEIFARAVNFASAQEDAAVLQQVRAAAASQLPVSRPASVESPEIAALVFPAFMEQPGAGNLEQPELPPVTDPVTGQPMELSTGTAAEIPAPEVEMSTLPELKEPELQPRPVSTKPAAGELVRTSPDADWTTREFPQPVVPREQTRVAVLGYHNFSNSKPVSEMRMRTSEFCQQMQYIKDAGLTVITMQDFLDWLLADRCLPERCVLITIDDGWRSVYTDAFPVLKAYGYPFTLYLYTSFLSGRGTSMHPGMVREMLEAGATIGSHSTTHLYPSQWKNLAEDSPEYAEQLQREFPDSVSRLKELFGNCSTYCYPGGFHTQPMRDCLQNMGVAAAFTVLEKKVTTQEDPLQVHRYMVFGNDPRIFRRAVNFDDVPGIKPTAQGITEARERARSFFPKAFEVQPEPEPESQPELIFTHIEAAPEPAPRPRPVLEDIPAPIYSDSL